MDKQPILSLRDVDIFYGEVQSLFGISLDVYEEEIVSIIGSNGAGKTTTMRSIMGLRPPKNGTITFMGERIDKLPSHNIVKRGIIYVPEGRLVFPDLSVQVNLEMGAYSKNYDRRRMAEKMEELNSITSPGPGSAVGGTTSSPVGMMPTTGPASTSTSSTPAASMAPMAAGETIV